MSTPIDAGCDPPTGGGPGVAYPPRGVPEESSPRQTARATISATLWCAAEPVGRHPRKGITLRTKVYGRIACLAAVGALLVGGSLTVSTAAAAAPVETPSQSLVNVHKPPRAPFVVDGVQYAPQEITKFNGRPLYFVVDPGKSPEMIGYTKQAEFDAAVASKRAERPVQPNGAGQYLDLYDGDELTGYSARFNSAWGVNHLAGIGRGCGWFGCAGDWDNVASSVSYNGNVALYDGYGYTGSSISLPYGYYWLNLSWYGWDNRVTSLNVWW
jgi:hypothetical protein